MRSKGILPLEIAVVCASSVLAAVTATNGLGSGSAASPPTAVVT